EAIAQNPDHGDAQLNLGHAILGTNRADLALPHALRAAQLRPQLPASYDLLGEVFSKLGRGDDAVRCHEESIRLGSRGMRTHQLLAAACLRRGSVEQALDVYQQARVIDP